MSKNGLYKYRILRPFTFTDGGKVKVVKPSAKNADEIIGKLSQNTIGVFLRGGVLDKVLVDGAGKTPKAESEAKSGGVASDERDGDTNNAGKR